MDDPLPKDDSVVIKDDAGGTDSERRDNCSNQNDQQQQNSHLQQSSDQQQQTSQQQDQPAPPETIKSIPEDLFSNRRWGTTPINQDTPWELPSSPTSTLSSSSQQQTQASSQQAQPHQQQQHIHQQPPIGGSPLAIPPGISQSGDNFHGQAMAVNNISNLVGSGSGGPSSVLAAASSRFDQPWRAPIAPAKPSMTNSFANHNLINATPGAMHKSLITSGNNAVGPSSFGGAMSGLQASDFARAPGPTSSILDSSSLAAKSFVGMAQRASTWSSFGVAPTQDPDSEWPKSTPSTAVISSSGNSVQASNNAFDLVHEFEPGKSWSGSNFGKSIDDDSLNIGPAPISSLFPTSYSGFSAPKSPTGNQYENSAGIGTWAPVVKGNRPGSMWDSEGQDNGQGDDGRFDDGTSLWGNPTQTKVTGLDWVKTGDGNSNNDKSRSMNASNNQSNYRQQQSSSASLLMSSSTSPPSQQNRNHHHHQQALKQSSLSQNFEQMQQQSNALSSQANQPNRGLVLSSNVPSNKHQQLQLTMVQQIQLAVQAGHLNPQILNQPLAPVTLQLLYQLLQHIKILHQLQAKLNQPGNNNQAALSIQMTKTKQTLLNLQNQIAAHQALHLRQQQAQSHISSRQPNMPNLVSGGTSGGVGPTLPPGISQSGDSFQGQTMAVNNIGSLCNSANVLASSRFDQPWRASMSGKLPMANSFSNHNLIDPAPGGMQKSMMNSGSGKSSFGAVGMQQSNEFARAPGPNSSSVLDANPMSQKPFSSGGGMTQRTSTWSSFATPSGQSDSESEWPKSSAGISTSNISSVQQQSNALDLVHEFEPGKPWRGSMLMRSVEDDPTMTPGSMARSLAPQRKTIWSDEIL